MVKKYILIILISLSSACSYAKAVIPSNFPKELLFTEAPIDPLCFFNMDHNSNLIPLKHCGVSKEKYVVKSHNADLIKKGYVGFEWQNSEAPLALQGYSYYKVFDAGNQKYWIYTINSGGGSGEFTGISLVQRKNSNTLKIKNIMGGDRCNQGVQNVEEHDHQITFRVNLTAYDVIALGKTSSNSIKAYDDLSACAVCCVAKAVYESNTQSQPKLNYIELESNQNIAEMPQQGLYQACFNQLLISYIRKGNTKLTKGELRKLVNTFQRTCVKRR